MDKLILISLYLSVVMMVFQGLYLVYLAGKESMTVTRVCVAAFFLFFGAVALYGLISQ